MKKKTNKKTTKKINTAPTGVGTPGNFKFIKHRKKGPISAATKLKYAKTRFDVEFPELAQKVANITKFSNIHDITAISDAILERRTGKGDYKITVNKGGQQKIIKNILNPFVNPGNLITQEDLKTVKQSKESAYITRAYNAGIRHLGNQVYDLHMGMLKKGRYTRKTIQNLLKSLMMYDRDDIIELGKELVSATEILDRILQISGNGAYGRYSSHIGAYAAGLKHMWFELSPEMKEQIRQAITNYNELSGEELYHTLSMLYNLALEELDPRDKEKYEMQFAKYIKYMQSLGVDTMNKNPIRERNFEVLV